MCRHMLGDAVAWSQSLNPRQFVAVFLHACQVPDVFKFVGSCYTLLAFEMLGLGRVLSTLEHFLH